MAAKNYQIHSFADIYPLLAGEELQNLADDIVENGLINPILVMGDVLIDGRNRLAACKLAGVEPTFKECDGALELDEDRVKAIILALNNTRRHLSAGQKAMALALAYPDAGHKHKSGIILIPDNVVSKQSLSFARKVLRLTPHLSADVMSARLPLSEAYRIAQKAEDEKRLLVTAQIELELFGLAEKEAVRIREVTSANDEKRLLEISQQELSRRYLAEKEAARIRDESTEARENRLQLMSDATASDDADCIKSRIDAMALADPEIADAVRTGAITLENADALLLDRQEETKSLEITARLELKDFVEFFRRYRKPSFRDRIGKAVTGQLNDGYREAVYFLVDFLNEFACIDRADGGGDGASRGGAE